MNLKLIFIYLGLGIACIFSIYAGISYFGWVQNDLIFNPMLVLILFIISLGGIILTTLALLNGGPISIIELIPAIITTGGIALLPIVIDSSMKHISQYTQFMYKLHDSVNVIVILLLIVSLILTGYLLFISGALTNLLDQILSFIGSLGIDTTEIQTMIDSLEQVISDVKDSLGLLEDSGIEPLV